MLKLNQVATYRLSSLTDSISEGLLSTWLIAFRLIPPLALIGLIESTDNMGVEIMNQHQLALLALNYPSKALETM